jgi:hypothetical protein
LKLRIQKGGVAADARLRAHLNRRLDFALASFGQRVARITVRLSRAEPRRAPAVGRCEIEVTLRPRSVRVADTGADLFIAVKNAADRLIPSVARALEREGAAPDVPVRPTRARRT